MSDAEILVQRLETLSPDDEQLGRMQRRVERSVAAAQTSLLAEWLSLFRARPIRNSLYAFGAAGLLVLTTPLATLALAVLDRL